VSEPRRHTPLDALHRELGGRMVDFAGWALPVQYKGGIIAEHKQCRERAALFDVSHMGQVRITGDDAPALFERLVPADIAGLEPDRARYTMLTNEEGGILDDLIVTRSEDGLFTVVNAARREIDLARIRSILEPEGVSVELLEGRALIALQGPAARRAMARISEDAAALRFMQSAELSLDGIAGRVSCSGYTGEDGFEISLPAEKAEAFARRLLGEDEVAPAGLGARDSLRLEAGLCLYGHDIDETTTPVEAGLRWSIGKRRREEGGFPGADIILDQIANGPPRRLVGLNLEGRAPAREGAVIRTEAGEEIGRITSGGFSPTLERPIAMGYVLSGRHSPGSRVEVVVRNRAIPAEVVRMPFVPHRYER